MGPKIQNAWDSIVSGVFLGREFRFMLVLIAKKNGVTSKVFVEFLIAMSIIIFLYGNIAFIRKILYYYTVF